jgi:hypothetical protein
LTVWKNFPIVVFKDGANENGPEVLRPQSRKANLPQEPPTRTIGMLTITQPTVTSQDVARRAVELGRLNGNREADAVYSELAQAEADEGRTHHWVWLCDANMLAHLKNELMSAEVYGDYATRVSLRNQIETLEAQMAADAVQAVEPDVTQIAPATASWNPGKAPSVVAQRREPIFTPAKSAYSRAEYTVRQRWASAWSADGSKAVEIEITGTHEQALSAASVAFLTKYKEHAHGEEATTMPPRKRRAA